ncbi:Neuronal pentraxin-1 [Channa argus]|uniref:Neuronal pentraxin-1 n=1 Tax=Channa argus TaxID=215402 RepID=A0A6G1PPD2_CHAAH|nr:Neuronal pentraxin-1 [Channa argus]
MRNMSQLQRGQLSLMRCLNDSYKEISTTFTSTGVTHFKVKQSSSDFLAELWIEIMKDSQSLHPFLSHIMVSLLSLLLFPASASSGPDHDYGAHRRFVCTPVPVDVDPSCFPTTGPGVGAAGPSGPGHQSSPPAGWWGASEEAKATILHLRESLVQQKETILDQRETIRELTAKLTLCEGFGQGVTHHNEHHGTASHSYRAGASSHSTYSDNGHYSNQQGHHGNLIPDSPHHPSVGGKRSDGGYSNNNQGKDKHVTTGDITSSQEQMERMLQALKDRLDNLQVSSQQRKLS